jgi:hypothetical protein
MVMVRDAVHLRLVARHPPVTRSSIMSSTRHLTPFPLMAVLAIGFTLTACGDPASDRTIGSAPPNTQEPRSDDPRIGAGLPAEVRFVGVEHNRLTLAMLRQTRDPAQRLLARQAPCETVVAGLVAESPRTAAAASIPDRADQLAAIVRGVMATHPRCSGRIEPPSMATMLGDVGVTAAVHPDSVLTDASFLIIDEMLRRIGSANSVADVEAAAATSATALGAVDLLAVQAAVAQSQGSLVLWGPGGSGWYELGVPVPAQNIFVSSAREVDFIVGLAGALSADGAGCRGALSFMRALPIIQDSRLLMGACGIGAAAGTVLFGYTFYHAE